MLKTSLRDWIIHRARTVKLAWPHGVADAAGIEPATLCAVASAGTLRHVSRSARSYIARALKISIRELEALDARQIEWISDDRLVDFDRLAFNAARRPASTTLVAVSCPPNRGVPVLGRILARGQVQCFDDWTSEDGPRLPIRYPGVPDAFTLASSVDVPPFAAGAYLAFDVIPPGELLDGELALLTHGSREVVSELCHVRRRGHAFFRARAGVRDDTYIELGEIPRAARLIGQHPAS